MRRRIPVVAGFGVIWVLLIAARLYHLQVVRYEHYATKAERQQQRVVTLDPPRGTIYDAHGRELAVSIQVDSVYAVPPEIEDPAAAAAALAGAVPDSTRAKLARQLAGDREFVWVARKLDPPVAERVRALELKGLYFVPESKRYYPMGELAAQVLGYVGTDNHGLAGLELVYDREITGKPGERTVLRDARQRHGGRRPASPSPSPSRGTTSTSRSTPPCSTSSSASWRGPSRSGARSAAAPSSSIPRRAACWPWPPTRRSIPTTSASYSPESWRNRAIADVYEPGSTFKIVTAAAALEAGVVRADDVIDCGMGGDHPLRHPHPRPQAVRPADLRRGDRAIEQRRRHPGRPCGWATSGFYDTIRGFGFGRQTGIDLPGESAGILHPSSAGGRWTRTTSPSARGSR